MLAERIDLRVGAVLLALNLMLPGMVSAEENSSGSLQPGVWRVDTPLGSVTGPCLYVVDSADSTNWRCEIAVAESGVWPTRDDLLRRRGRGWTVTGGADGGFFQPWNEPWRQLGRSATESVADLLRRWSVGPVSRSAGADGGDSIRRWRPRLAGRPVSIVIDDWSGLPAAWRPPTSGPASGGALRRQLTARGTGRGGDGLVLDLRWQEESLAVTSARWPGRLTVKSDGHDVVVLPGEAFLPLWPLAEFLR